MVKRYCDVYLEARRALLAQEGELAEQEAKELICHCSGKSPADLLSDWSLYGPEDLEKRVFEGVRRILDGEPLPYIIGEWDFGGMTLKLTKDTLIPRDDSLALAELAADCALRFPGEPRILDLCTGSGCIGLFLANRIRDARVILADISTDALSVAKENVRRQHLGGRVSAVRMDAKESPPQIFTDFDMIVCNPPYVTREEMISLPLSVKNYEPELALYGGEDGLDFYRSIVSGYACALKEEGILCFEFGRDQENDVCRILEEGSFQVLQLKKDLRGIIRAVSARKN